MFVELWCLRMLPTIYAARIGLRHPHLIPKTQSMLSLSRCRPRLLFQSRQCQLRRLVPIGACGPMKWSCHGRSGGSAGFPEHVGRSGNGAKLGRTSAWRQLLADAASVPQPSAEP